ncbi:glutathione S-transferase family protein [Ramlibacter sp. WS9]|uniref:glutathione S-transferase family protein n=1 Tax=Ramlibacter sp. WS9 TaxID=1882741 RepID=UPI00114239E4|nr:glutathione S-transferase family protein [Ramlibacter sp. WS9]ROZ64870.1 glutathione S-transferase family protein [Ramlibacter sp. WS9]
MHHYTLVSHHLCPYVQRAAIVLAEKGVPFERRHVDLAAKPDWFRAISPLGKTPVLLVQDEPLFESAVICEYLDETLAPRLHPQGALERARERGWMEFGSAILNTIAAFYNAPDAPALQARREELGAKFMQVEQALHAGGPWFAGARFGLVDAVFGPVFRYFDVFESLGEAGLFGETPRVHAWRQALAARPSVNQAVSAEYPRLLHDFLIARSSELSRRIQVSGSSASVK